ncbi:MAG: HAMP domain-containing sensor histidine kinase, partial [Polyangiales bacterium]
APRCRSMRLFTRLLLSHSIPALILTIALAVSTVSLMRIGVALTTLSETELATLHDEGEVHQASWGLDVAMRHGLAGCARGEPHDRIRELVSSSAKRLQQVVKRTGRVTEPIRGVVESYLGTAREVLSGDPCEALIGAATQQKRAELDERLTNLWVDRLNELHTLVSSKEESARRMAVTAASLAIPLAILSFLFAMWSARQMASRLEEPLVALAGAAQRVGRGDFETPVAVDGPPEIRALAVDLDRMRKELQQIESFKQGFLASVSHELRTPLSKIREGLALLQDGALGPLDERKLRVVQIARAACEREIRMVTTLLDLSRLRAGSPLLLSEEIAVDVVIDSAVESERAEATQRGVDLQVASDGPSVALALDATLLERAIANIVRNAIAVSARGQQIVVRRSVDLVGSDRCPGGSVRIRISDEGPGVPEAIRDKVFDAFVTRSVPGSGKALGIGIGLALAREVARAHGGDIELHDREPRGSEFILYLPLSRPPERPSQPGRTLGLEREG